MCFDVFFFPQCEQDKYRVALDTIYGTFVLFKTFFDQQIPWLRNRETESIHNT